MSLSRREFLKMAGSSAAAMTVLTNMGLSPAMAQENITIRKMAWGSPLERDNIEAGLANFMQENPGITVDYIHTPERYNEVLQTMLASGNAPDVYKLNTYPDLAARGALLDITDLISNDPVLGDPDYFFPFEEERSTYDGRWYGIGSTFQWRMLYYNRTLLEEAGIPLPSTDPEAAWSWDEFIEYTTRLTTDSAGNHPSDAAFDVDDVEQWGFFAPDWHYDNYVVSNGGLIIDPSTREYALDQQAAYEGVQAFADLRLTHMVAPQASMLEQMGMNAWQMLASGRVAIIQDGNWALQDISQLGMDFGVAVLPALKEPASITSSSMTGIYSQTENPEAAWELFRYLNLDEYQAGLIRSGLWGVSHRTLLTPEGIDKWWNPSVHPENWLPLESEYKFNYGHVIPNVLGTLRTGSMLGNGLAEVWIGRRTAQDVLTELTPQLNATLAEEQANL